MEGVCTDAVHIRSARRRADFIILGPNACPAALPHRLALPGRLVQAVYDPGAGRGDLVAHESRASNHLSLVEVINGRQSLPSWSPSRQRVLDPILDDIKAVVTDPTDYLCQDLLAVAI